MVFHTNGLHPTTLLFCECDNIHRAGNRVCQLLRYELYPATVTEPTTCFTFNVLDNFHLLTLQSKITAYDYYMTLDYTTDNIGLSTSYVSLSVSCASNMAHRYHRTV